MTPRSCSFRTALPAAATTIALLMTACGGDDGGGSGGLATGDDYSIEAALAELPARDDDADGGLMISTADLAAASELAGVERPQTLDADAVIEWLGPLTGPTSGAETPAPVFVPMADMFNLPYLSKVDEFAAELGWSVFDVEAFVEESRPPYRVAVVAGDFDESPLADDLEDLGDGVLSAGTGADHSSDLSAITAARPLGTPVRLAYEDGLVAASSATPAIEAWLAGPATSRADDERLTSIAAVLDDADAVAAVLVVEPSFAAGGGELSPDAGDELVPLLPSDPFDAVGIGWSVDDDQSAIVTLAYHFASDDAATASLTAFEAQYEGTSLVTGAALSELVTVRSTDTAGPVAIVTLEVAEDRTPAVVFEMLLRRDLPFIHA